MQRFLVGFVSVVLVAGLAIAECQRAGGPRDIGIRRGIPIIYGHGETIKDQGKLPDDVQKQVEQKVGAPVSIGYMYSYFHIYYADLWTWNGQHVIYSSDTYWKLDDNLKTQLLGNSSDVKLSKPVLYQFPPGLMIVFTIALCVMLKPIVFPSTEKQLARLSGDPQYMSALEVLFPPGKFPLQTDYSEQDFETAVNTLTGQGMSRKKAEKNLRLLAAAITVSRTERIQNEYSKAEVAFDKRSPAEGIAGLEEILRDIPANDPHHAPVSELLKKLQQQQEELANSEPAPEDQAEETT